MGKGTLWLIHTTHDHTVEVFGKQTGDIDTFEEIMCSDGVVRRMFCRPHEVVKRMWEGRVRMELNFSVWKCEDGDGKKRAEPVDMFKEFGAPAGRIRRTAEYRRMYNKTKPIAKLDPASKGTH